MYQGDILRLVSDFTANVNQHNKSPTNLSLAQLLDTVPASLHARLRSKDGKEVLVDAEVRNKSHFQPQQSSLPHPFIVRFFIRSWYLSLSLSGHAPCRLF